MEIWKDVPDFGNYYQASNLGRIKSKARKVKKFCGLTNTTVIQNYKERILNPSKNNKCGHLSVHIGIDNKKYTVTVHKLVLLAFFGKPKENHETCHNNGIAWDNRIENLRWDTHANNNLDRKNHGKYATGKDHPMYGKPVPQEIKDQIRNSLLGNKHSEETKKRMRQAQLLRWEKRRVSQQETA